MLLNLFSIRDIKNDYSAPISFVNSDVAIRAIRDALASNSKEEALRFPEDKELWFICTFDTVKGVLVDTDKPPKFIVKLSDLVLKNE